LISYVAFSRNKTELKPKALKREAPTIGTQQKFVEKKKNLISQIMTNFHLYIVELINLEFNDGT